MGSERKQRTRKRARLAALGLCLPACFAATPAFAYRTGEDSPSLAGRGRVAWASNQVGFSMSESNLPTGVTKQQMEQALTDSLAAWLEPECSAIEPIFYGWSDEEPLPRDGKNTIAWVTDWAERGFPELTPGNTDMQYHGHDGSWDIAEADVYLDAAGYDWTTVEGEDTSVQAVLTHELGHALGLLHTCEPDGADTALDCKDASAAVEATTMFPFYDAAESSLTEDDVAGLCYLYPTGEDCNDACVRGESCVDGECRATCGDALCASGEACGFWGCTKAGGCLERDCAGAPCKGVASCGPLATCQQGFCSPGTVRWGDRCAESADCAGGACVESVCQPACMNDADCGRLGSCVPTADGRARGCISSGAYEQGLHCAAGEDCLSGICIFTQEPAVCTATCKASASCPDEWSCRTVDQRDVCVPPTFEARGGCNLGRTRAHEMTGANGPGRWMLAGAALLLTRRWRRRNDK